MKHDVKGIDDDAVALGQKTRGFCSVGHRGKYRIRRDAGKLWQQFDSKTRGQPWISADGMVAKSADFELERTSTDGPGLTGLSP